MSQGFGIPMSQRSCHWLGMNQGKGWVRKAGLMAMEVLGADGYKSPAISLCIISLFLTQRLGS